MAPESLKKSSKKELVLSKDRISQLPDDILQGIISLLPTNYAIGTCILSTRWKTVWMGIPNLYFSDEHYFANGSSKDELKFINFVDKTILLRDANVINKFHLSCGMFIRSCCINPWISYILRHKVEEVSLEVIMNLDLPLDLLNCKSLKVDSSLCIFTVPSSVCMSVMKVLHLSNVQFTCNQEIQKFCFTCPVLEELDMNSQWEKINSVIFHAPTLKRLIISTDDDPAEDDGFEIKFYAESLISLRIISSTAYKYALPNLSSLREAFLESDIIDEYDHVNLIKILESISSVHHLTLTEIAIQEISDCDLFTKLLGLSSLKSVTIKMLEEEELINGDDLTALFRNLPNVETLVFIGGLAISNYGEDLVIGETYGWKVDAAGEIGETHGWKVESTPQPSLPNLKSVALYDVYGNKKELGLVKFLLKNASALEKITITSSSYFSSDLEKHLEFSKQLQFLSTLSTGCLVDFT